MARTKLMRRIERPDGTTVEVPRTSVINVLDADGNPHLASRADAEAARAWAEYTTKSIKFHETEDEDDDEEENEDDDENVENDESSGKRIKIAAADVSDDSDDSDAILASETAEKVEGNRQ